MRRGYEIIAATGASGRVIDRTPCGYFASIGHLPARGHHEPGALGIKEVRLIVPEEDGSEMCRYTDRRTIFTGKLQRGAIASDPLPIHYWARIFVVDLRDP